MITNKFEENIKKGLDKVIQKNTKKLPVGWFLLDYTIFKQTRWSDDKPGYNITFSPIFEYTPEQINEFVKDIKPEDAIKYIKEGRKYKGMTSTDNPSYVFEGILMECLSGIECRILPQGYNSSIYVRAFSVKAMKKINKKLRRDGLLPKDLKTKDKARKNSIPNAIPPCHRQTLGTIL